ncbi:hypothetical protein [Amycolatopsis regifaucium]|uniref:hypothetical protein n=1 Tax=Amycolatopsis regifaucium TaxID=546365 RepID=UPI0008F62A0D|nr:hypothetical protein [Amycolatopsis regifaucium]SFH73863.1 hypothetical protein SAMN04489731_106111 [Amycolatopsis regifaucium]
MDEALASSTTCIQTLEICEHSEPILLVQHDNGIWQLIGASDADGGTGKIGHPHHAIDSDHTLIGTLGLPPGGSTTRTGVASPWHRQF